MEKQDIAVDHLDVPELVAVVVLETRPAPEVVKAEDLSGEAESACQVGHVNGRSAQESADLDDGAGADPADKGIEDRAVRAPALDVFGAGLEEWGNVGRREIDIRGSAIEDSVQDCLADELRGDWVGRTVSGE